MKFIFRPDKTGTSLVLWQTKVGETKSIRFWIILLFILFCMMVTLYNDFGWGYLIATTIMVVSVHTIHSRKPYSE